MVDRTGYFLARKGEAGQGGGKPRPYSTYFLDKQGEGKPHPYSTYFLRFAISSSVVPLVINSYNKA